MRRRRLGNDGEKLGGSGGGRGEEGRDGIWEMMKEKVADGEEV